MESLLDFTRALAALPESHLVILVALSAIALAGFALFVVHSINRDRR